MACPHDPASCQVLTSALLVPPASLGLGHTVSPLSPGPLPAQNSTWGGGMPCFLPLPGPSPPSIQSWDEMAGFCSSDSESEPGLSAVEKSLLGSKTHLSCLSSFLWLENSREGVLGAGWGERRLQGDSGGEDRAGATPEAQGCPWPGRREEGCSMTENAEWDWEAKAPGWGGPKARAGWLEPLTILTPCGYERPKGKLAFLHGLSGSQR